MDSILRLVKKKHKCDALLSSCVHPFPNPTLLSEVHTHIIFFSRSPISNSSSNILLTKHTLKITYIFVWLSFWKCLLCLLPEFAFGWYTKGAEVSKQNVLQSLIGEKVTLKKSKVNIYLGRWHGPSENSDSF